jgi:hypothetical protein
VRAVTATREWSENSPQDQVVFRYEALVETFVNDESLSTQSESMPRPPPLGLNVGPCSRRGMAISTISRDAHRSAPDGQRSASSRLTRLALPPTAPVLTLTVRSVAKRAR